MEPIVLEDIHKVFTMGGESVRALNGVSLTVPNGEYVAVMGASGSGKSTLMNILGCLDRPTRGEYCLDGIRVTEMSLPKMADIRNRKIGFVFQGFNLLPRTSALENVELPLLYSRSMNVEQVRGKAVEALVQVGLANRMDHHPSQLSGGQQQRVAIARALVNNPAILLADEPTGNLDSKTTLDILSVFNDLNDRGITVILVTHEADVATHAKRIITMKDGNIIDDQAVENRCAFGPGASGVTGGGLAP